MKKKSENLREKPQKEKAVLETANNIIFALAESSKNTRSLTNLFL